MAISSMILSDSTGEEIRIIHDELDLELGPAENSFEIRVPYTAWTGDMADHCRVYIPGTEFGGIILEHASSSLERIVTVKGYTWRGMLQHYIIEPPAGEAYRYVSGDLNECIDDLVGTQFSGLFDVSQELTGVSVTNYRIPRYVTALEAISRLLADNDYKLRIRYLQTASSGYVLLEAVPLVDHSEEIEMSSDGRINFVVTDCKRGVNHLVCLGKGDLAARTVVHLYAGQNGAISQTKYYTGINEIAAVYDNNNAELDDLIEAGTKRLKDIMNYQSYKASAGNSDDIDIDIGDIISGRDFISGTYVSKPIEKKVLKIKRGKVTVEYGLEGET